MHIFGFIFEGLPLVLVWHKLETNAINITTQILTFIFPFVLFFTKPLWTAPSGSYLTNLDLNVYFLFFIFYLKADL